MNNKASMILLLWNSHLALLFLRISILSIARAGPLCALADPASGTSTCARRANTSSSNAKIHLLQSSPTFSL
ncbi:uncharacterized protein BT62DRAFT_453300 [Guyanagaster necrorhizus]|uniref:Secreted protein n=1 Tax=Guyanagaster necrorhizus TaxID=856835 RepID=A0A9P8ANS3_9AGAR|nr:uncharacterized protein BT62DRAFT_453300 [Guyanagaster necrorhizus MCA 3950]KAG7442041.1 hypothetical protein BT62DRAFT_453300 [Guyanagaster necrorhizus MCA 3950]